MDYLVHADKRIVYLSHFRDEGGNKKTFLV